MLHDIIATAAVSVGLLVSAVISPFSLLTHQASTTNRNTDHSTTTIARPNTLESDHYKLASSTPITAEARACVAAAVATREQSLTSGMSTFTGALNAAYTARASALANAYNASSTTDDIKNAVKVAWTTFTSTVRSARKGWVSSQNAAWSTFKGAVRTCKAPTSVIDSSNASSEVSLQQQ